MDDYQHSQHSKEGIVCPTRGYLARASPQHISYQKKSGLGSSVLEGVSESKLQSWATTPGVGRDVVGVGVRSVQRWIQKMGGSGP